MNNLAAATDPSHPADPTDPTAGFRHRTTLEVRFRDIDAFRHVNNAAFFTYIEQARIRYLIDTLHLEAVERLPLILAAVQIDFRSPILFGQEVEIGTRVDWIGHTSFSVSHVLHASGRLAAEARTVLVSYDYGTERPIRVPDNWRAAFAAWESRDLTRPGTAKAGADQATAVAR